MMQTAETFVGSFEVRPTTSGSFRQIHHSPALVRRSLVGARLPQVLLSLRLVAKNLFDLGDDIGG